MRKYIYITLILIITLAAAACGSDITRNKEPEDNTGVEESEVKMKLKVGEYVFRAALEENSSVEALKELLSEGPVTLNMTDYAGMEKCADLGKMLPQNNVKMNTKPGDIILYQGRTIVIYYDTNSWSLTPIGRIENVNTRDLRKALGKGNVKVTLSME